MERLERCPFCKKRVAECGTVADNEFMSSDDTAYYWAKEHYQVVCNYNKGGCGASTSGRYKTPEEAIAAWNMSKYPAKETHGLPETDLDGKCGSCEWAKDAADVFTRSHAQIRCTCPALANRMYYGRPASRIKARTQKACKHYEVRE